MRFSRSGLLLCCLFLSAPSWAQQPSGSQTTPQVASDPQAVAVVQAAITALGGATAISQAQSWTFQAQMRGAFANGSVGYVVSTDTDRGVFAAADGSTRPAPPIHSHFVPALIASILLKESQDPRFSFFYEVAGIQDVNPVSMIRVVLTDGSANFVAQFWWFDASGLPVLADFRLPAEIGARVSFPGVVRLSNYQTVSGVRYPFSIVAFLPGGLPQTTTIQSITTGSATTPNEFNGKGGDLR